MPVVSYHMVHYRSFKVPDGSTHTLESLCRSALAAEAAGQSLWLRPSDRIMTVAEPEKPQRQFLMNRVADLTSAIFGEVCSANQHDLQAMLAMTTQTKQLTGVGQTAFFDLSEAEAPNGQRFIRGIVYWLAIGNHLFFITLQAFTARQLISYLTWLIAEIAHSGGHPIDEGSFNLELDASTIGADGIGKVKRLRVRGNSPLGIAVEVPAPPDVATEDRPVRRRSYARKKTLLHEVNERAMDIIEAVLGPAQAKSLLDSLGPGEYVAAEAEISIKGSRTERSLENVKRIASAIADETDAHVEVEGSTGKISDGDAILRMRMPFDIRNEGGTLLDFDNVADQIQKVYNRFVEDGKISV